MEGRVMPRVMMTNREPLPDEHIERIAFLRIALCMSPKPLELMAMASILDVSREVLSYTILPQMEDTYLDDLYKKGREYIGMLPEAKAMYRKRIARNLDLLWSGVKETAL